MKRRVTLIIHGEVQGVSFRSSARFEARQRALTGYIRNNPNKTTEIVAEGQEEKLQEFIRWCSRGPLEADVTKVETAWQDYKSEFTEFNIL